VIPSGNDDLRPLLFKTAVDNGLTLIGLAREGQNLEQIFRELTTSQESASESSGVTPSATAA
jgi:hypothetical protein